MGKQAERGSSQALVRGGASKPVFQSDAVCEGERKEPRGPGAPGDCPDSQGDMSKMQTRGYQQTSRILGWLAQSTFGKSLRHSFWEVEWSFNGLDVPDLPQLWSLLTSQSQDE